MSGNIQLYRFMEQRLPPPERRRLVLLTGARQTGKTTLARAKYPRLRYVNLDAPENREAVRVVSSALWAREIGPAVLDEAQKEPVVFDKVKFAYDDQSLHFSVLLGSSQILLLKKIRETLAGRVMVCELWPLMMSEIFNNSEKNPSGAPLFDRLLAGDGCAAVLHDEPAVLLGVDDALRRGAQNHLLAWGGMPSLLRLSSDDRRQWLKDYEVTYLERDLTDLARLNDLMPFRKFQRLAALRSGMLLNYAELARDAGLSVDTARRYLEYLRLSYQTFLLPPYHTNLTSTVVKTPKVYWLDVGLLRQLTGIHEVVTGEIFESMVVGECVKWIKTMGRDAELYFYRTRSGLEVDLLVETPSGVIGVEIKSRESSAAKDVTALKEIASTLGKRWKGGLVVHAGTELRPIADPQIWAVPSYRLFT